MTQKRFFLLIIPLLLLASIGCSSTGSSPMSPADNETCAELPFVNENHPTDDYMAGFYTMDIDIETLDVNIVPDRRILANFNVTALLPPPVITINSFNPGTGIVDADVTINNDTNYVAYDLRLIIYTTNMGHKLVNNDNWTDLFDIPGGLPINPFKAYNKDIADRPFPGKSQSEENLQIYLPGGNAQVSFAITASFPGNCLEPYEITNFSQGTLYDQVGSSAKLSVDVRDHQDDVDMVQIFCPVITGTQLVPFTHESGITWELDLVNNTGAVEGEYTAYLMATSSGQSLYDEVIITISDQHTDAIDLTVVSINRGERGIKDEQITSVSFDWDDHPSAVEYAFERADGYTGTGWTIVDVITESEYDFIPQGLDLDEDIRFRVIPRAEQGGNPNTDFEPTHEVFILFMSNMGDLGSPPGENNWKVVKKDPSHGLDIRRWYWGVDDWGDCALGFYGDNQHGVTNTNTWAIAHTPFEVPNLSGSKEAYFDGYISPGANWNPDSLGFVMGTLSAPPTPGAECHDFKPATDILGPEYFAYNNPNCEGINQQFGETNQDAWRLTPDFNPTHLWRHVGYFINDLLDPERRYIALGFANGNTPLDPGTS